MKLRMALWAEVKPKAGRVPTKFQSSISQSGLLKITPLEKRYIKAKYIHRKQSPTTPL